VLDFPRRPKGLQRRLARRRSNAQAQSATPRDVRREPRPIPPANRRTPQSKGASSEARQREAIPPSDSVNSRRLQTNAANPPSRPQPKVAPQPRPRSRNERRGQMSKSLPGLRKRPPAKDASKQAAHRKPQQRLHSDRSEQSKAVRTRTSPLVYLVRLLIVGIGVGAIMGTVISIWDPNLRGSTANQVTDPTKVTQPNEVNRPNSQPATQANVASVRVGRELTDIVVKVTPLIRNLTDLVPGIYVMDVDNGDFFSFNGSATFSAASLIKLPILIAFFQDVDAGKIKLDEMLLIQQTDVAEGSGDMQYAGVGTQYSALETATSMIVNSDNTATNMIIRRLGGIQALNQRFRQWGLQQTLLRKPLPDLEGTNTTSPKELASLMALLNDGKLVSMKSRDRAFEIMRRTVNDSLLPSVMSPGSTIAHKTGDIGTMLGDVGMVDLPTGRRYAVTAMVKRPHNDARAQDLIRQIAAIVYEHFGGQPTLTPSPIPSPGQMAPQQPMTPTMPTPGGVPSPGMPQQTMPQQPMPQQTMPQQPGAPAPQTGAQPMPSPTPVAPTAPAPSFAAPSPVAPGIANPEIPPDQSAPPEPEAPEAEASEPDYDAEADANAETEGAEEPSSEEATDMTFLPEAGWGGGR
jgi:beta-lactamase class A